MIYTSYTPVQIILQHTGTYVLVCLFKYVALKSIKSSFFCVLQAARWKIWIRGHFPQTYQTLCDQTVADLPDVVFINEKNSLRMYSYINT